MGIPQSVEMSITELQQVGDGTLADTANVYRWTGAEHTSAQGDLELYLKVNTVRKDIPGSNLVVEHVLAATWQPFVLHGEWDDKWANRRQPQGSQLVRSGPYAFFMYHQFAAFVRRAPLVRLEIDSLSLVGIITDLRLRYQRSTKIGWSITISPHSNDVDNVHIPLFKLQPQPIPKWIQDADQQRDTLETAFDNVLDVPVRTTVLSDLASTFLEIDDALDFAQNILDNGLENDTVSQLLTIASTMRRVNYASQSIAVALMDKTSDIECAFEDPLFQVRFENWVSTTVSSAWALIGVSSNAEQDMRRRAGQRPQAIYYPKTGESLERISNKFYGTPNSWRTIYDANHLSSLVLDGTEELIIPDKRTS